MEEVFGPHGATVRYDECDSTDSSTSVSAHCWTIFWRVGSRRKLARQGKHDSTETLLDQLQVLWERVNSCMGGLQIECSEGGEEMRVENQQVAEAARIV